MKLNITKRERRNIGEWHWRFAWLPVRVSASKLVWWEHYYSRLVCVAEGNWAGGDQWQWEYVELGGGAEDVWKGPLICN